MNKTLSNESLMSISEFAEIVGASRSQLIYYDRINAFSPMVRSEQGTQSTYRYYTADQIYSFNMLNFYLKAGCSLNEAGKLCKRAFNTDSQLLNAELDKLKQQQEHTLTMIHSIELMLEMEQLIKDSSPENPASFELSAPLNCRYYKFEKECRRGTKSFVEKYAKVINEISSSSSILPFPIGLIYNPDSDAVGYFPVRGVLVVYRYTSPCEKVDFILPAGKYLAIYAKRKLQHFTEFFMPIRNYLISNNHIRTTQLIGWNMNIADEGGEISYSECITFGIINGKTPEGQLPVLPEVY